MLERDHFACPHFFENLEQKIIWGGWHLLQMIDRTIIFARRGCEYERVIHRKSREKALSRIESMAIFAHSRRPRRCRPGAPTPAQEAPAPSVHRPRNQPGP